MKESDYLMKSILYTEILITVDSFKFRNACNILIELGQLNISLQGRIFNVHPKTIQFVSLKCSNTLPIQ